MTPNREQTLCLQNIRFRQPYAEQLLMLPALNPKPFTVHNVANFDG